MKFLILSSLIFSSLTSFAAEKYFTTTCMIEKGNYVGYRYKKEGLVENKVNVIIYKNDLQFDMRLLNTKTGKLSYDPKNPQAAIAIREKKTGYFFAEQLELSDAFPNSVAYAELKKEGEEWKAEFFYDGVSFNAKCPKLEVGFYEE